MSAEDEDLFGKMIRVENKDLFVDLRKNANGIYLKISERKGTMRKTVLLPASGIRKLQAVLEEVAEIAEADSNNKPANNKPSAKQDSPKQSKPKPEPVVANSNTVYVAGLDWNVEEAAFSKHFEKYGTIVKATIIRKPRGGKIVSAGCGTIEFASAAAATRAIEEMNGTTFAERQISVREDRVGRGNPNAGNRVAVPTKIFVSNIPLDTSAEAIRDFFCTCGDVKKLDKLSGRSKKKGFWVIEFEDSEGASSAISRLNHQHLNGQEIVVREYNEDD